MTDKYKIPLDIIENLAERLEIDDSYMDTDFRRDVLSVLQGLTKAPTNTGRSLIIGELYSFYDHDSYGVLVGRLVDYNENYAVFTGSWYGKDSYLFCEIYHVNKKPYKQPYNRSSYFKENFKRKYTWTEL